MSNTQMVIIFVAAVSYASIGSYVFIKTWKRAAKEYAKSHLKAMKKAGVPITPEVKEALRVAMTTGDYVDTSIMVFAAYAWPFAVLTDFVFKIRRRHADRKIESYQRKYDLIEEAS